VDNIWDSEAKLSKRAFVVEMIQRDVIQRDVLPRHIRIWVFPGFADGIANPPDRRNAACIIKFLDVVFG
jgi:hypothetical protein